MRLTSWLLTLWSLLVPNQQPLAPLIPDGGFRVNGEYANNLRWARPRNGEIAYDSGPGSNTGILRSGSFVLPPAIHFYVAGFTGNPGIRLYLLDESRNRTLNLTQRIDPTLVWRLHIWDIPKDWQGATVRVVAEDHGTGPLDWIGITPPKSGGEPFALSLARAVNRSALLIYVSLLFLLPGIALAILLACRFSLDFIRLASAVVCGSGIASYLAFWAYFNSPPLGKALSGSLIVGSLAWIVWRRKLLTKLPGFRETLACLGLALFLSVAYSATGAFYFTDNEDGEAAEVRFGAWSLPIDNLLPGMLAQRIWLGQPTNVPLADIWHSSDRPPLESAATLLVYPLAPVMTLMLANQLLSVFLQCLSVAGLWALARGAGLSNRYLIPLLGFAIFSQFCTVHSVFVWPKLMAAGYLLFAMAPIFRPPWTMLDVALSSTSLALGLLSHTGILFTLVPLAVFVVVTRRLPNWRQSIAGLAIVIALMLPWRWFQSVYDPPGDFLLKFNMTSYRSPDMLNMPLGKLLVAAYTSMTPQQYLDSKWDDLKIMFSGPEMSDLFSGDLRKTLTVFIAGSFFHLFFALGLLNAGLICRFFCKPSPARRFADQCLAITAGSILLWIFVLFPPGATVVHQWSLANVLILFMILVIYMVDAFPRLVYPLLAAQALILYPAFLFAKPLIESVPGAILDAPLDMGMLFVALICLAAIAYAGWRAKLQEAV